MLPTQTLRTKPSLLEDSVVGKHVYGDLYGVNPEVADNEELLREAVVKAAELAHMHLVEVKSWRFGGRKGGVSVLALVIESHIAIHTWPEYRYATIDVYTCGGQSDPWKAFYYLIEILQPEEYTANYIDRSLEKNQ
ncbi:adenosylmethionine decarboxylase [Desulfurococcaceae archaeon MEX13E-LK6-19]|nr:adenosylmethionine decarboxylase [Desulfurococcaceae archaeon MEX13E-LK6-19]